MTTEENKQETNKKNKPVKKQGPLRTGAVVPVTIVFVLSYIYFTFLFDANLRSVIEWTISYVHGAEVNVKGVKTSFTGGSFHLSGLQITNKENPKQNILEIGDIRFGFLWDALLRAKFVVNESSIEGIQLFSTRRNTGWVKPPEPPSTTPSALSKIEQNALEQTKKDYDKNILGDLAKLLEGTDDKEILNQIKEQLQSEKKIAELQKELKEKEKAWKERIDNLPNKKEFDEIHARSKALKFDSKDPKQFAKDLKEASQLVKEADKKFDAIKGATKDLKSDLNKYSDEIKAIDDMIDKDIKDIESRLKLPDLDIADFSKNIFGRTFSTHLSSIQKYMEVGRKYMPPPKDPNKKEEQLIPPPRGKGENIKFKITTGYPLFWLKKAVISSKATQEGFSGDIKGVLTDVTTDPAAINKPIILDVKGDFPNSKIFGTYLLLNIDHRAEPVETLEMAVGTFPLSDLSLVNSSDVKLNMKQANGSSVFNAQLKNQVLNIVMKNEFSNINYDIQSEKKSVSEIIGSILNGIPKVTLNAKAMGSWDDISLHMNSNLGEELAAGMKRVVKEKVDAIKKKIKAEISGRIDAEKQKLNAEYKKIKDQVDNTVKEKTDEIEKSKKEIEKSSSGKSDSAKDKAKDDVKKKAKKLLKGLKF